MQTLLLSLVPMDHARIPDVRALPWSPLADAQVSGDALRGRPATVVAYLRRAGGEDRTVMALARRETAAEPRTAAYADFLRLLADADAAGLAEVSDSWDTRTDGCWLSGAADRLADFLEGRDFAFTDGVL